MNSRQKFQCSVAQLMKMRGDQPEIRAEALCAELGLAVETVDLPPNVKGRLVRDISRSSLTGFKIQVSPWLGETERTFVIAHEIAHFVLDAQPYNRGEPFESQITQIDFNAQAHDARERRANRLAAALLMPEHVFTQLSKAKGATREWMANRFGVSVHAVDIRARELSIPLLSRFGMTRRQRLSDPYGLL